MIFVCCGTNDLYCVLKKSGHNFPRVDTLASALQKAGENSCILILADSYPKPGKEIDNDFLQKAREKSLRLYIEYPSLFPGLELGHPCPTCWERVVATSDFFSPGVEENEILGLHGCWFLPVAEKEYHLAAARVAGYRKAVYGLPEKTFPLLFHPKGHPDIMVAASSLSNFITGRYGPAKSWKHIWEHLLGWLLRTNTPPAIEWQPTVHTSFTENEKLPSDAEAQALNRLADWFRTYAVYSVGKKKGVVEGYESGIDYRGRQMLRAWPRSGCIAESAMYFACDSMNSGNPDSGHLAGAMLDYVFSSPDFLQDDPDKPVYGLVNWYERGPVFYSSAQGKIIISALGASAFMGEHRWDEHILRCLLATLRLTGPLGFTAWRWDYPKSFTGGKNWEHYRDNAIVTYRPHYQSYIWAANLWAYALTGHRPFYEKTSNAIRMTMNVYPDGWKWTNGLKQEIARMLLPLAWLIRIDDRPEYRSWLNRVFTDLVADMQPCGAIRERLGKPGTGTYPPPPSNEKYGTSEAPLIQEDGDPSCDLLYSMEHAFIGLHEAFLSTGDRRIREAEDRMAEFFCRIQVSSKQHPCLDGTWMRGFDYKLWEYWGSSADVGWGAWSVETGWTNAWIGTTLELRKCGRSLFHTSMAKRLKEKFPALLAEMNRERKHPRVTDKTYSRGEAPGAEQ